MEEQTQTTETPTLSAEDIKGVVTESISETLKPLSDRVGGIESRFAPAQKEEDDFPDDFAYLPKEQQKQFLDSRVEKKVSAAVESLKSQIGETQTVAEQVKAVQMVPSVVKQALKDVPQDLKPLAEKFLTDRLTHAAATNPKVFKDIPQEEIDNIQFMAIGYAMKNKSSLPQDAAPGEGGESGVSPKVSSRIKEYWRKKTGQDPDEETIKRMAKSWA